MTTRIPPLHFSNARPLLACPPRPTNVQGCPHFACQEGHETVARFLITQRADVNKTRGDGGGPLFAACQNGFPQFAAILLASNAKLEHGMQRSGTTPLMAACLRGCTETVELLLSAGATPTVPSPEPPPP